MAESGVCLTNYDTNFSFAVKLFTNVICKRITIYLLVLNILSNNVEKCNKKVIGENNSFLIIVVVDFV